MIEIHLRYIIDSNRKTLSLAAPDGSLTEIASTALNATRGNPDAEGAWRELLGDAIEAAACAAQGNST